MKQRIIDILESNGWVVECESPLEIRNDDGSFASGIGAQYTIDGVLEDSINMENPEDIIRIIRDMLKKYFTINEVVGPIFYSPTNNNAVKFPIQSSMNGGQLYNKFMVTVEKIIKIR